MGRDALVFEAGFRGRDRRCSRTGRRFAHFHGGLHHRLRAPRQAIDALHPGPLLPCLILVEGRIDAAQRRLQGNAGLAPGLDQRPIQRGKQQKRPAPLLEAFLNLGKIIKVVTHYFDLKFAARRTTMATVGFVGLGIMGRPMLRNLLKAGHTVVAYGRTPAKLDAAVADGAQRGASNADVGARAPIVVTMLPDGPEVEEVVLGPNGILSGSKPGSLIIDMSSISPLVSQKIAAACAEKGVDFVDAPVSGGEPKAVDGTLAIMVGASDAAFQKAEPILKCMGSSVTLTGPVGAGNTTKLANQIMVACNIAAMGEALTLATRCGLNPEVVVNAVKGGLAGSAVLNAKGPMLIARNFKPGFRISLHQKDLRNALKTAEANSVCLPLTAQVQQMISSLIADGKGDFDHSAIATFVEEASHVEVKVP